MAITKDHDRIPTNPKPYIYDPVMSAMYPTNIGDMKDNDPPIVKIQAVIAAAFSGLESSASSGIVAWKGVYHQAPIP